MNEIERTKRQRELEADYMKACSLAHDQSRDGLAQHLYAAQAQYALAELAASPEVREMHLNLAQHHRTFVAERKRMLAASAALNGSEAASAGQKKEDTARAVPATGKKPDDELRGFDPENCRVKAVPAVTFADITGSRDAIQALEKAFRHNEELFKYRRLTALAPLASKPDHHLMYGPPGTGKSFLCKAIANQIMTQYPNTEETPCNSAFFNVNSAEICSPYYSVAEKRLEALFAEAEKYAHCVICIDEMERLCPDRNASGTELNAVADAVAIVTRMLQLIDGITGKCNAVILCATNYPWKVDKAMRDRLSSKLLLDLPDNDAKREFLHKKVGIFLGRTPEEQSAPIEFLLGKLANASYRDLDTLAQAIQVTGLHKTIANHPGEYELAEFDPLSADELSHAMDNVVIAYDAYYHARLKNPSRWSNEGEQENALFARGK